MTENNAKFIHQETPQVIAPENLILDDYLSAVNKCTTQVARLHRRIQRLHAKLNSNPEQFSVEQHKVFKRFTDRATNQISNLRAKMNEIDSIYYNKLQRQVYNQWRQLGGNFVENSDSRTIPVESSLVPLGTDMNLSEVRKNVVALNYPEYFFVSGGLQLANEALPGVLDFFDDPESLSPVKKLEMADFLDQTKLEISCLMSPLELTLMEVSDERDMPGIYDNFRAADYLNIYKIFEQSGIDSITGKIDTILVEIYKELPQLILTLLPILSDKIFYIDENNKGTIGFNINKVFASAIQGLVMEKFSPLRRAILVALQESTQPLSARPTFNIIPFNAVLSAVYGHFGETLDSRLDTSEKRKAILAQMTNEFLLPFALRTIDATLRNLEKLVDKKLEGMYKDSDQAKGLKMLKLLFNKIRQSSLGQE